MNGQDGLTAEQYRAVVAIVDDRLREVRVVRESFDRLEAALERLTRAQVRTEKAVETLTESHLALRGEMGQLSANVGLGLEGIAQTVLPGYLERHFGIKLEGELGEELQPRLLALDGREIDLDLYGTATRNGKRIGVIVETKWRIHERDVLRFEKLISEIKSAVDEQIVPVLFGTRVHPKAAKAAAERDIVVTSAFQR